MIEDPEVYYSCSDCVLSFIKEASNGVYIDAATDHAGCAMGCGSKATVVCRVYPGEQESDLKENPESDLKGDPEESCKACCNMTVTESTLFKARKAIMLVVHSGGTASQVINELLNAGLLIRERI